MAITKLTRDARMAVVYRATWGGSQNFLGARWVERLVRGSPPQHRERLALRFLSISPHYFYDRDVRAENARNRQSRQVLANELIVPHLTSEARVLDYGCGPGYLAHAVASHAAHVDAVDISRGVLACANVLNARQNITYQTPEELASRDVAVDVAYSFAVAQHLRTEVLTGALSLLASKIRAGGTLLLHFAVPDDGLWRTEAQWRASPSVVTRVKLRYGLNCFGRSAAEMSELVTRSGFTNIVIRPLDGAIVLPGDDVATQHLLTAQRL